MNTAAKPRPSWPYYVKPVKVHGVIMGHAVCTWDEFADTEILLRSYFPEDLGEAVAEADRLNSACDGVE